MKYYVWNVDVLILAKLQSNVLHLHRIRSLYWTVTVDITSLAIRLFSDTFIQTNDCLHYFV